MKNLIPNKFNHNLRDAVVPIVKKKTIKNKLLLWGIPTVLIAIMVLSAILTIKVNDWFEGHKLIFHAPVQVNLYQPVKVEVRKPLIVEIKEVVSYPGEINTPIKKYICDKFGLDCKVALAIVAAESNFNDQAYYANNNGSVDIGIFQINSVHFKQAGCSLKEVVDQYKNVDCAYQIYKASGWTAWSTFINGSFKNNL